MPTYVPEGKPRRFGPEPGTLLYSLKLFEAWCYIRERFVMLDVGDAVMLVGYDVGRVDLVGKQRRPSSIVRFIIVEAGHFQVMKNAWTLPTFNGVSAFDINFLPALKRLDELPVNLHDMRD